MPRRQPKSETGDSTAIRISSGEFRGRKIEVGSLSSYAKAVEIAERLADEIRRGEFLVAAPMAPLPREQKFRPMKISGKPK